mmetsp:Transcript_173137/g.555184  ORF Transcript_173137/g.555184 Transcript_173137/m.555184 type:complete len:233 (+) Transcript_173137:3145-3843(+)
MRACSRAPRRGENTSLQLGRPVGHKPSACRGGQAAQYLGTLLRRLGLVDEGLLQEGRQLGGHGDRARDLLVARRRVAIGGALVHAASDDGHRRAPRARERGALGANFLPRLMPGRTDFQRLLENISQIVTIVNLSLARPVHDVPCSAPEVVAVGRVDVLGLWPPGLRHRAAPGAWRRPGRVCTRVLVRPPARRRTKQLAAQPRELIQLQLLRVGELARRIIRASSRCLDVVA